MYTGPTHKEEAREEHAETPTSIYQYSLFCVQNPGGIGEPDSKTVFEGKSPLG
jgi:hypothetical protein